ITRDASFRARDAFISPSAAITCKQTRGADAAGGLPGGTAASCTCSFTSLISTRSTLMPQLSVASSRLVWKRKSEEATGGWRSQHWTRWPQRRWGH
uniref:Uncharacterized protein n=1 Tax=Takifugu rubripes TaxID=31033 RepID=A0A3B5KBP0_TAKRU